MAEVTGKKHFVNYLEIINNTNALDSDVLTRVTRMIRDAIKDPSFISSGALIVTSTNVSTTEVVILPKIKDQSPIFSLLPLVIHISP